MSCPVGKLKLAFKLQNRTIVRSNNAERLVIDQIKPDLRNNEIFKKDLLFSMTTVVNFVN